jgi:hypothetical protein
MCIPVPLEVPVLTSDSLELGTAREILCPHTGDEAAPEALREPIPIQEHTREADLWLHVERANGSNLFVPFAAIAEVRLEGVRLAVTAEESERLGWDSPPPGVDLTNASAA